MIDTSAIRNYVYWVDTNSNLTERISEGKILNKRHKAIGGFSISTYCDKTTDIIHKISYHDNSDKNIYLTFYYQRNKLVLANVRLEKDGVGKIIYYSDEFYVNDSLLVKYSKGNINHFKKRFGTNHLLTEGYELFLAELQGMDETKSYLEIKENRK